jgi:hypothetical protein
MKFTKYHRKQWLARRKRTGTLHYDGKFLGWTLGPFEVRLENLDGTSILTAHEENSGRGDRGRDRKSVRRVSGGNRTDEP